MGNEPSLLPGLVAESRSTSGPPGTPGHCGTAALQPADGPPAWAAAGTHSTPRRRTLHLPLSQTPCCAPFYCMPQNITITKSRRRGAVQKIVLQAKGNTL